MRLLCDHNVAAKYIRAFEQAEGLEVTTVADELSADAPDDEIATHARRNELVLFTSDDDFFDPTGAFGLLVYSQIEDPRPGEVVRAVATIDRVYESNSEIVETVPGDWA